MEMKKKLIIGLLLAAHSSTRTIIVNGPLMATVVASNNQKDISNFNAILTNTTDDKIDALSGKWFMTPLMMAVRFGNAAIVEALLKRGANPKISDLHGRDSFWYLNEWTSNGSGVYTKTLHDHVEQLLKSTRAAK